MSLARPGAILALGLMLGSGLAADPNRAALIDALSSEKLSVLVHWPRFDDPELQSAAAVAVSRGARVRLILSRDELSSRRAAEGLRARGMQVRFSGKSESQFVVTGSGKLALGRFEDPALIGDDSLAREFRSRFEVQWKASKEGLPSATVLKDELEALPDPRENEPRMRTKRRRN